MRLKFLITLIVIGTVFTSCKKDSSNNSKTIKKGTVKEEIKKLKKRKKKLEVKKNKLEKEIKKIEKKQNKFAKKIVKSWVEPIPGNEKEYQGFKLNEDGTAESINMATLVYKSWKLKDDKIIFIVESRGNHNSAISKESFKIESVTNTTLRLSSNNKIFKYKNYKYIKREQDKRLKEKLKNRGTIGVLSGKKDKTFTLTDNSDSVVEKGLIKNKKDKYSRKELEKRREEKRRAMQEAIKNRGSEGKNRTNNLDGDRAIEQAFKSRRSNMQVETSGIVVHILPDDTKGHKHQKFILKLNNGRTILIAHNIDLAPKIKSLKKGDRVYFYGEYEWSDRGGVVHWTHKDPGKRHKDGWLKHNNKLYQ